MKLTVLSVVFAQQPYCVFENFRTRLNTRRGFCDNSPSVRHQVQCHGTVAPLNGLMCYARRVGFFLVLSDG